MSRGDEADDQQQAGMPGEGDVVCLQCLFDTCNPSSSWSPSRFETCHFGVVYLEGLLVGGHACQMSKPLDSLLLYVVVAGIVLTISLMCSFLITSRLVLLTTLRHLISQVVIFLSRLLVRVHVWHWYVFSGGGVMFFIYSEHTMNV